MLLASRIALRTAEVHSCVLRDESAAALGGEGAAALHFWHRVPELQGLRLLLASIKRSQGANRHAEFVRLAC